MAKFHKCPRCGNHEKGYAINRCRRCGGHWCYRSRYIGSSGCGAGLSKCPHCGQEKSTALFFDHFETCGTIE